VGKIVTRLRTAGVQMQGDDDWTSGKPALPIDFQAGQYLLVNAEPKEPQYIPEISETTACCLSPVLRIVSIQV
jgi:hypothetical protein